MPIYVESLLGKRVILRDRRGSNDIDENNGIVRTTVPGTSQTTFVIESSPAANAMASTNNDDDSRYVAFRVDGTSRYLTLNPYGNARAKILEVLSSSDLPMLLPDLYEQILDYLVGKETDTNNFEGRGFNYDPMRAEESSTPTILQSFCIVGDSLRGIGMKSMFGTYWRSQHWENTVSQSPHMMLDETWRLSFAP